MASQTNPNKSSAGTQGASQVPKPKLPPIEPNLKNLFAPPIAPSPSSLSPDPPNKPKPADPPARLGLILVPIVLLLLVLGLVYFFMAKKGQAPKPAAETKSSPQLTVSSPDPKATPPALPKVEDQNQAKVLKEYFSKVSPANFKDEFMGKVPKLAADAYNSYVAAQGDAKFEAARAFYIYLNNPGIDRNNAQMVAFLADVKKDLEKTVGKALF